MTNNCLNCNQSIDGNFCSNCGQKTSTHRFSIQHFFVHDFIHGILHFDKGLLHTLKELFTRPGHSIREYIQGKRANHFNCFATVIFILTLDYLVSKEFHINASNLISGSSGYFKVAKEFSKIVSFIGIPFYGLASYLIFKKSKQNYTENLVLNIYMLSGWLFISFILKLIMIFVHDTETFHIINLVFIALIHIYVTVFYYQYFSGFKYTKLSLAIRAVLIALLILTMKQEINDILNEIGIRYFH